jgi:hypothetical protein
MKDLLKEASAWLDRMRGLWTSRTVEYRRGLDSVELAATVGRTIFEKADQFGVLEQSEARDYLVLAADLVLAAAAILPERGDRIVDEGDGAERTYEVLAPGTAPPWTWADPYRRTLRIHTREVE